MSLRVQPIATLKRLAAGSISNWTRFSPKWLAVSFIAFQPKTQPKIPLFSLRLVNANVL
jgi:hypothetical protein